MEAETDLTIRSVSSADAMDFIVTPQRASPAKSPLQWMADSPFDADISTVDGASPADVTQLPGKTKKRKVQFDNDNIEATTTKKMKPDDERKRKKAEKIAQHKTIPRCYDECEEADKKLIDMRDAGGSWADIRKEWKKLTGSLPAQSTLPNRYSRLKSNFAVLKEEDNAILILAKQEVEDAFEQTKWEVIAQTMVKHDTQLYHKDVLQRQYKKLMLQVDSPAKVKELRERKKAEREKEAEAVEKAAELGDVERGKGKGKGVAGKGKAQVKRANGSTDGSGGEANYDGDGESDAGAGENIVLSQHENGGGDADGEDEGAGGE